MKIYRPSEDCSSPIIWLFGGGLIGSAISTAIESKFAYIKNEIEVTWGAYDQISSTVNKIIESTGSLSINNNILNVTVVWAAGRAGFYSTIRQIEDEYLFFHKMLDSLIIKSNKLVFSFIFFSSAGALYEGRININYSTNVCIKRPYGTLKCKQEEYLRHKEEISLLLILRPSSVYGFIDNRIARSSLIATLIDNALSNRLSTLYGNLYTLRNYIWVEDIANFVLRKIFQFENGMHILAGPKSHSIIEIKKEVEKLVKKRVYFKLNSLKENESDIAFAHSVLSLEDTRTTVSEGIRKIMQNWDQSKIFVT